MRDARTIGQELAHLIGALQLPEPIILLGHSMGALFNRALLAVEPRSVRALIWLDPAHPEQIYRRRIRARMRHLVFYIEAAQLLATKGVPAIEVPLLRHLETLPEFDFRMLQQFLRNPRHLRTTAREVRAWPISAEQLRGTPGFDLPLLIVSGRKNTLPGWDVLQADLTRLSSKTEHRVFSEMSHISMLANRAHAQQIAGEIRSFVAGLAL
jgi:pimeloyl-ACP methyl ester carboxylesterase